MRSAALAVLLALSAVTCGGGGGPLPRETYIAKGDAICSDLQRNRAAIPRPTTETPEALADYLARIAESLGNDVNRFTDLEPPPTDRDKAAKVEALARQVVEQVQKALTALRSEDSAAFNKAFQESDEVNNRFIEAARDYGFKVCGKPPGDEPATSQPPSSQPPSG